MIELHTGEKITFVELITKLCIALREDIAETWAQAVEHVRNDIWWTY
jgi:hypothetical protein